MKGRIFLNGEDVGEFDCEVVEAPSSPVDVELSVSVTEAVGTLTLTREGALQLVPEAFVNAPGGRA